MNNRPNDSQISAWFDNELSVAERAEVERRLEQSSDARDELTEVETISDWIAELPGDALPRDFARQIVAAATETVTAAAEPVAPAKEPVLLAAERVNASTSMRWTRGFGVLISAVAVLLVAVMLINGPSVTDDFGESSIASMTADSRSSDLPAALDGVLHAEAGEGKSYAMGGGGAAGANESAKPTDLDRAETPVLAAMKQARRALPGEFKFDDDLNRVVVGQEVDARLQSGGQVAVVRLTVVDRVEGLENLQLLLTGNRIAKDTSEYRVRQSGDVSKAANPGTAKPTRDDYLVAVYVEASEQQLSAVFDKIRKDSRFQSLQVDRPIAVDQLAQASPPPLQVANRARSNESQFSAAAKAAPSRPTEATPKVENSDKPNTRRRAASDAEKRKSITSFADAKKNVKRELPLTAKERLLQKELERVSRQLKIVLPRKMLLSKSQPAVPFADEPADEPADDVADNRDKSGLKSPEAEGAKLAESRAAGRSLQVLFVLDVAPKGKKN